MYNPDRKHSPGPFSIESGGESRNIVDSHGELIATLPCMRVIRAKREIEKANASLFRSAPELLASLKAMVKCLRSKQLGDYSPLMDEIFDAENAIEDAESF